MKSLKCSDLGGMGCNFEARGEDAAAVKKAMYEHAAQAHKDMLASMTPEQQKAIDMKMDELLK